MFSPERAFRSRSSDEPDLFLHPVVYAILLQGGSRKVLRSLHLEEDLYALWEEGYLLNDATYAIDDCMRVCEAAEDGNTLYSDEDIVVNAAAARLQSQKAKAGMLATSQYNNNSMHIAGAGDKLALRHMVLKLGLPLLLCALCLPILYFVRAILILRVLEEESSEERDVCSSTREGTSKVQRPVQDHTETSAPLMHSRAAPVGNRGEHDVGVNTLTTVMKMLTGLTMAVMVILWWRTHDNFQALPAASPKKADVRPLPNAACGAEVHDVHTLTL